MGQDSVARTFCFVDLAGFTALTEAHGDADAVALLDRFLAMTRESIGAEDELVKSIGDAVMLASPRPSVALRAVVGVVRRCAATSGFPLARAGAHHGSAIARDGDYLGGAVNLAARVAGHARGGQLLATTGVADAARAEGMEVLDLGPYRLRNVSEPVQLFEICLGLCEAADAIDPVCRMRLDPDLAGGSFRHEGAEFWFCSLACIAAFASDPGRYLPTSPAAGS